jgi:hypothetical protein
MTTCRTAHHRAFTLPLLVLALGSTVLPMDSANGVGVRSAFGQPDTGSTSPSILKRLAEIADGHRTGKPIFVVLSRTFPHPVINIVGTRDSARAIARRNPDFGVFGPFVAPAVPDLFIAFCEHDRRTTYMEPDSTPRRPRPSAICDSRFVRLFQNADIDSLSMTFHLRDRTRVTLPVPRDADALFFTLPAMDKFVFPYYVKVLGVDTVAVLRREFIERLRR